MYGESGECMTFQVKNGDRNKILDWNWLSLKATFK